MILGRTMASLVGSSPLVACNVYVSAGRRHHADLLLKVLVDAQNQCKELRQAQKDELVSIVHAYADGPYDRSSFHLAGAPGPVAQVASSIAMQSIQGLAQAQPSSHDKGDTSSSRHPFVGLVDHVSVMPLQNVIHSEHGDAARSIGKDLEKLAKVFYYGDAHPQGTPLSVVRREKTSFFQSNAESETSSSIGISTVGAPPTFVENFNIRLTSNCNIKVARSLTKFLRERDGGLPGVEALTLPYSNNRFEMAGNLLQPKVGSANAVQEKLDEWVAQQLQVLPFETKSDLVDKAYQVGTTPEQCLEALALEETYRHDEQVLEQFQNFITNPE